MRAKVVVILGPTASGKTALAIKLALRLISKQAKKKLGIGGAEIISADSRQIYRGLDIGTAKPTLQEQQAIPHRLINIRNPNQPYTVAQYKRDCLKAIRQILKKNKLPIIVGGTGLYIKAVVRNLAIPKVKADPNLRAKLEKEIKNKGVDYLYQKLTRLDPEAAYIVDPHNPRRMIRALEIALKTNRPFSETRRQGKPLFDFLQIGISLSKEKLKKRIDKRIDAMVEAGLVEEVRNLTKKYSPGLSAFEAIGYREIIDHLNGKSSLEETIELMKHNTWQFAKRQLTWFRKVEPREQSHKTRKLNAFPRGAESRTEGHAKGKYLETGERPSGARDNRIHWTTSPAQAEKLIRNFLIK